MTVRECLRGNVITIEPDAPVSRAWALMQQNGIRYLPVVDRDHRLIGVVALHDTWTAMSTNRECPGQCDVRSVMLLGPHTVAGGASIHEALTILGRNGHFGALPVVTEGHLEGIVAWRDLLGALSAEQSQGDAAVPATIWDREAPDSSAFLG